MSQYKFKDEIRTNDTENVRMTDYDVKIAADKEGLSPDGYVNQYLDEVNEEYYSIMEWKETHVPNALFSTHDLSAAKACARDQYGDYDTVYRAYVAFADRFDKGEVVEVTTDIWEGRQPDKRWLDVYDVGVSDR